MVSRSVSSVQARRYAVLALATIVIARSSTVAGDANVRDGKQVENEWASTSKRNHKGPNTYEFRYDVENAPSNNIQYRVEERHPNGSVVGSYGQVQPDGNIKVVAYVADNNGVKTYVKDKGQATGGGGGGGGGDNYVAEGSSFDPVQRVTSQIIQTAGQSQQHRSPLYDKYHRPTPSAAAAAGQRVDKAHTYHQQRTNLDPASFRPVDSPGYQETHMPFVGDQLQDKLHVTNVQYQSAPQLPVVHNPVSPLPTVVPYNLQQHGVPQPQQHPGHYMLNVPPLPSLGDNSPLPLLPGQQPLPITPDRGPIMIQLQQPQQQPQHLPPNPLQQQQHYQYQPSQVHPQQTRPPANQSPQQQYQYAHTSPAQQYQQQPVRVQPPAHLQQQQQPRLAPQHQPRFAPQQQQHAVQYQPQQARVVTHQALPPQNQHQQQQQQQQQQLQQQQQHQLQLQQQQQLQLQQQQQQQNLPYQQSVMQQPFPNQVNIPAHPSQIHVRGNVQQHQAVVPMQYFHQPNPATTAEQYRQQLQLQAAESQIYSVVMLPPTNF